MTMTDTILFDRLTYIDRLKRAGVDDNQARAHAEAMDDALRESVVTKAELRIEITHLENKIVGITSLGSKIVSEPSRLATKFVSGIARLETKIEWGIARLESKIEWGIARLEPRLSRNSPAWKPRSI